MNMMTAVKTVLSKYVDFTGRASRSEYWWWYLAVIIISIVLSIVDMAIFGEGNSVLGALFSLGILLPFIAVSARRLHDIDRSGWWMLIALIPIIGWILVIYWYTRPSDEGANRFGENPFGSSEVFE